MSMTAVRRLGLATLALTATTLGWAAPASADLLPPVDGTYTYAQAGGPDAKWRVQTICSLPSGTREQSDYSDPTIQNLGCTVVMRSYTQQLASTREEKSFVFSGRARLTNGMWTFQTPSSSGVLCPDGSTAPSMETFAFAPPEPGAPNPNVTGMRTSIHDAVCGLPPGMVKTPFTLSYDGPLDPPVGRFPQECDYLAGRPSICS